MFPRLPVAILGALTVLACSDSTGPSAISIAQLAGTWDLSRLDMLLVSDTTVSQNVVAQYGLTASLTINRNGTTMLTVSVTGSPPDTAYTTIAIHGDTVAYGDYEATVRLHSRTMTWLALESSPWDIDNDGTPEDVLERDVWQRR
jgi:hypothetical protein